MREPSGSEQDADSGDRERSIRSFVNTESGDHEHLLAWARSGLSEWTPMMVSCHHRQLFGRIFDARSSSFLVFLFGWAGRFLVPA